MCANDPDPIFFRKSGFGHPGVAPAFAGYLAVLEYAAWRKFGARFTGEQGTVVTELSGAGLTCTFGKLGGISFAQ